MVYSSRNVGERLYSFWQYKLYSNAFLRLYCHQTRVGWLKSTNLQFYRVLVKYFWGHRWLSSLTKIGPYERAELTLDGANIL